jgi:hypothetical protein
VINVNETELRRLHLTHHYSSKAEHEDNAKNNSQHHQHDGIPELNAIITTIEEVSPHSDCLLGG